MKKHSDSKSEVADGIAVGSIMVSRKKEVSTRSTSPWQMSLSRGWGSVGNEAPELYMKTIERLGLHVSTQFKHGSDVKNCIMEERLLKQEVPDLADNHSTHEQRVWE